MNNITLVQGENQATALYAGDVLIAAGVNLREGSYITTMRAKLSQIHNRVHSPSFIKPGQAKIRLNMYKDLTIS